MAFKKKRYDIFNESLESYYWVGFLFADGHFSRKKTIVLKLHVDDLEHLEKFKKFTKTKNKTTIYESKSPKFKCSSITAKVTITDSYNIPLLCKKYNIADNKTKIPPILKLPTMTDDQLLSMIIGYIDGDGCINHSKSNPLGMMRLKVDASWLENIKLIEHTIRTLSQIPFKENITKLNNRGYAQFQITNSKVLKWLKQFTIDNNLPILDRKWRRIII